jgi:dCTP deaminase
MEPTASDYIESILLADFEIEARCTPETGRVIIKDLEGAIIQTIPIYDGVFKARRVMEAMRDTWSSVVPVTVDYVPYDSSYKFEPMIEPFHGEQIREVDGEKVISFGLSSYGYDIQCADEFKVFTNINSAIVDPKNFDPTSFVEVSGKGYCIIPPNSFALARTVEYFRIPRNILTICLGKSTYARCGIIVNVTPFEPEWEGYVTLEFSNTTPLPAKIYANEGVAQVVFLRGNPCRTSYKDRGGKYQGQTGVTTARL